MSAAKQEWLKGSLTGWLITVMLALNCYFAKRYVDQVDAKLQDHESRISKIEARP